jgi:hypothetical protein
MTSRARELPYTERDHREVVTKHGTIAALVREWNQRKCDTVPTFHSYLRELADAAEQLFQYLDGLWLYGSGGRQAFDAEMVREDALDHATLTPAQLTRRRNRAKLRCAAEVAGLLISEAKATGEQAEAQRLERAFVHTVVPSLMESLRDKDAILDRAAVVSILRGDPPGALTVVSLDDTTEVARGEWMPRVLAVDDPFRFPPATIESKCIGLFAAQSHVRESNGVDPKAYPRVEVTTIEEQAAAVAAKSGGCDE